IEITGANYKSVFTKVLFGKLLPIIKRLNGWGASRLLYAYVRKDDQLISSSLPQFLPCPVQPHNGALLPLDETNNGPKLLYLGDSDHGPFYGRMLEYSEDLKQWLFKYGGVVETDNTKRGFDCITYVGAVTK